MTRFITAAALLLAPFSHAAQLRVPTVAPRSTHAPLVAPPSLPTLAVSAALPSALRAPSLTPTLSAPSDAPAPSAAPLTPAAAAEQLAGRLQGTEILLIQSLKDENGRSRGRDLSSDIEAIVTRRAGTVRNLERDGPSAIFADTFAIEVQASARAEVLAELKALPNAEVRSLSELLARGLRRAAPGMPDAATLAAYPERLKDGYLPQRWSAFAELASILERAAPAELAALPVETRDALVIPLYGVAYDAVNAYNLVQGAARQDLRKTLHDAQGEKGDWKAVETGSEAGLKHPGLRARFAPLRDTLTRVLETLDRLDTPESRQTILRLLPHADYAGLELAARPGRAQAYADTWLAEIAHSVEETRQGLEAPPPAEGEKSPWHGSERSGGYTHVDGQRQSKHLYKWRPYRFDPAESRHTLALMLGLPRSGASIVEPLLDLLTSFQSEWPRLQELHKRRFMAREQARAARNLENYRRQAELNGTPYTAERLEQLRRDLLDGVEDEYRRHNRMDGHTVIDNLLLAFSFRPYFAGSVPGFDEAAYVANALAFFSGAAERLDEPGLVRQLADGALQFLTELAAAPLLNERPELRASAVSAWRALSAKAASLGILLNTRLDGVIDPRPEKRLVEPADLQQDGGDATVWQLAPSPDGRFIAQATGDRRVRVWDARTRLLLKTIVLEDARQLYGDLANSLGVSWHDGKLLVTTLHDGEEGGRKYSFNKIRTFDPGVRGSVLGPADALSEVVVRDAYVLRDNARGVDGPFYASPRQVRNEQGHYLGAEVDLIDAAGRHRATIHNAKPLGFSGPRLLLTSDGRSTPRLDILDVADPAMPRDATPEWLKALVAEWTRRNGRGEYGWWPEMSAKLGSYQGRPALIFNDRGRLNIHDLETGAVLRSLEVPSGWNISPYLTDASGTRLAAIVTAPGQFAGPSPERVVMWDLSTGELIMDRDATYVPTGWIYSRGAAIAQLEFSADGRTLVAAGRKGVLVFELPLSP